jgi:hypothetical protein
VGWRRAAALHLGRRLQSSRARRAAGRLRPTGWLLVALSLQQGPLRMSLRMSLWASLTVRRFWPVPLRPGLSARWRRLSATRLPTAGRQGRKGRDNA